MQAKDVQAFFERVASDWDTMRLAYYDERVIEKMAEVSGVGEASEVADVGTGTGFVAAGIAPRVKRVVGIDNAPAMLEVARKNLHALGASNVESHCVRRNLYRKPLSRRCTNALRRTVEDRAESAPVA
jgi:ubiquinone/menaquinone biosynthesis C-methylase UbiE